MTRRPTPQYLPALRQDVSQVLAFSKQRFGAAAAERYGVLIQQTFRDLLEDPTRPGAKRRPELAPDAYLYHLAFSRDHVLGERVKNPRHFVLDRYTGDHIAFARLLHDSRDLTRSWLTQ